MRALSLIPAVFIAITSFVSAAPFGDYSVGDYSVESYPVADYFDSDSAADVSIENDDTTQADVGDYSVAEYDVLDYLDPEEGIYASTDDDDNTKPIVDIISSVKDQIQPLSEQFASAVKSSDVDEINNVASQMNEVISNNAPALQNAVQKFHGASEPASLTLTDSVFQSYRDLVTSLKSVMNSADLVLLDAVSGSYVSMATLIGNVRVFFVPLHTISQKTSVNLGPTVAAVANCLDTVWELLNGRS